VKRTVVTLTALATLGAAYLGSRLWAQTPPAAPAAPAAAQPQQQRPLQTRIGMVNLVQVLKDYEKFKAIEAPIQAKSKEWEAKLGTYRSSLNKLKEEYQSANTTAARKEQIEKESRNIQMQAQIAEEDAKKELTKLQGDAAVQVYQEVKACVERFAATYGYEAVFFYNDAITPTDLMHPMNVQRKLMQPACLMPMYADPRMDISKYIVDNLNTAYRQSMSAGTTPAAPAPRP